MAKNYQGLWENVTSAVDEAQVVRTLAEIVVDKDGRVFISSLERESAELCIEILDRVSHHLHSSLSPSPSQIVLSGHRRTRARKRPETGFLRHVEETCWMSRKTTTFHDYNKKDRSFRRDNRLRWICRY